MVAFPSFFIFLVIFLLNRKIFPLLLSMFPSFVLFFFIIVLIKKKRKKKKEKEEAVDGNWF
jgi:preprotein translocase subunit YajC